MEPAIGGLDTLFDDALIAQTVQMLGVDEITARFVVALHRGAVTGDVVLGDSDDEPSRRAAFTSAAGVTVRPVSGATVTVTVGAAPPWPMLAPVS